MWQIYWCWARTSPNCCKRVLSERELPVTSIQCFSVTLLMCNDLPPPHVLEHGPRPFSAHWNLPPPLTRGRILSLRLFLLVLLAPFCWWRWRWRLSSLPLFRWIPVSSWWGRGKCLEVRVPLEIPDVTAYKIQCVCGMSWNKNTSAGPCDSGI